MKNTHLKSSWPITLTYFDNGMVEVINKSNEKYKLQNKDGSTITLEQFDDIIDKHLNWIQITARYTCFRVSPPLTEAVDK
jgi:hypothetical protein